MSNEFEVELDSDIELEEPKKYKVILLNDDYSTMDFVVDVLVNIFRKTLDQAASIMMNIHNNGKEVCGIYPYEIALTKVTQVKEIARKEGFPLKAIMEEE